MRMLRMSCAVSIFCFASAAALAQQSTLAPTAASAQVVRDRQAVSLLAASYQALGGASAAAIQDTHTTVQITYPNGSSLAAHSATMETSGANMRFDDSTLGTSVVVNGGTAIFAPAGGTPVPMSKYSLGNGGITHLPVFSVIGNYTDATIQVVYVGEEPLGSSTVHHIQMQQPLPAQFGFGPFDEPCDIYVDSKSLLVSKIVFAQHSPFDFRSVLHIGIQYNDYRAVSGILVPYSLTYSTNGVVTDQETVTAFAVNQGTQPSDFQIN
jgi:hypothetical protein